MKKYKVPYHGSVYVEADDESEAFDKADAGDTIYEEQEWDPVEEVDEFIVGW